MDRSVVVWRVRGRGIQGVRAPEPVEGMAATTPRFDRMVPAAPDTVGAVRRELRRWARRQGASPPVQANVALAFSEACASVIGVDGSSDPVPGPLVVQAVVAGDELRLRVSHRSRGVPPSADGLGYGFGL